MTWLDSPLISTLSDGALLLAQVVHRDGLWDAIDYHTGTIERCGSFDSLQDAKKILEMAQQIRPPADRYWVELCT